VNTPSNRLAYKPLRHIKERIIESGLFLAAFMSVATTFAIVAILVYESVPLFKVVSLWTFLTDTQWTPLFDDAHYGIMPLVAGTRGNNCRCPCRGHTDGDHHRHLPE